MLNKALFKKDLKRLELLNSPTGGKEIQIAVYRNHSFEIIANVLNYFLNFSKLKSSFIFSDYDDSLNFNYKDADIQLIWIDTNRYKSIDLSDFLNERVSFLRSQTKSPILIAYVGDKQLNLDNITTDCFSLYLSDYIDVFGECTYDLLKETFSGTRLSNKSCLEIARVLGLKYIPALLLPTLKAIIVDLDNTLYKGVLGEDGIHNVIPNNEFQKTLKDLKQQGFFLCIASKNEENDIKKLFETRKDFVLQWDDFTTSQINWNRKSDNIINIAKTLNIGLDSILFIDDNPAEIQNVQHLDINVILADDQITQIIKYYPNLLKLKISNEDAIRSKDIQANIKRKQLAKQLTLSEYYSKLGITLEFCINDASKITRISELFNKTNQFILAYARYSETDVAYFMKDINKCIISIKMSDNLSDSGIIAILAAHKIDNQLYLDELVVSCRALGRRLENIMLPYLFKIASDLLHTNNVINIIYKKGGKNIPALQWLEQISGEVLAEKGTLLYQIPQQIDLSGLIIKVDK